MVYKIQGYQGIPIDVSSLKLALKIQGYYLIFKSSSRFRQIQLQDEDREDPTED